MKMFAHYAIRLAVGANLFVSSGIHGMIINITA